MKKRFCRSCPASSRSWRPIPGIRIFPVTPPALPGGGQFPVEFVLASTAEAEQILEFAQKLQLKAMASNMFAFPPLIDMKIEAKAGHIQALYDYRMAQTSIELAIGATAETDTQAPKTE